MLELTPGGQVVQKPASNIQLTWRNAVTVVFKFV